MHTCLYAYACAPMTDSWKAQGSIKHTCPIPQPHTNTHKNDILKKYFSEAAQLGTAATWKTRQRLTLKMELVGENYNTKQTKVINCPVLVNSSEMVYVIRRQRPLLKCCGINWKLWSKIVNYKLYFKCLVLVLLMFHLFCGIPQCFTNAWKSSKVNWIIWLHK